MPSKGPVEQGRFSPAPTAARSAWIAWARLTNRTSSLASALFNQMSRSRITRPAITRPKRERKRKADANRGLAEGGPSPGVAPGNGRTERESAYRRGTPYHTPLVFETNGELVLHHRKLMPTYKERTVWGQGDGSSLATVEVNGTRIGGL